MKRFGLIGKSLKHSFSKSFFEDFFEKNEIEAEYINYELSDISEFVDLAKEDISGLNVTIPYKEEVIPFLDSLSEEAKTIGAVNVIEFREDKLIGHNTDAFGFAQSLKPFITNQHQRAIVFGTGGASKAVQYALKNIGIDVVVVSRNPEIDQFNYDQVNDHMLNACKLLVNCTPIGTYPDIDESIQIPFEYLTPEHLVVDLIYNPAVTKFLHHAEIMGAMTVNGEAMLKHQALKSLEIWNK